MLEQSVWYRFASGSWILISEMSKDERDIAAERLFKFALSFARTVYEGLYCYGYPSGEQAQIDLERGEAEAEHVMSSNESAQEWMAQTPLYCALTGSRPYEDWEPEEVAEAAPVPPRRADEQMRTELAELNEVITRTEKNLQYLLELRGRLS
jgi:hypothetical protein